MWESELRCSTCEEVVESLDDLDGQGVCHRCRELDMEYESEASDEV